LDEENVHSKLEAEHASPT